MIIFNRLCMDPNEDGTQGGGADSSGSQDMDLGASINAALNKQDDSPASGSDDKASDDVSRGTKEIDDKSKTAVDDDPEHELDFEEEAGKGKVKCKLSQLKETAKWLHQNKSMIQGTLKIREEASKNPSFGKLLNTVIQKAYNDKGEFQGAYIDNVIKQLEGQQEKVESKIEDTDDDIKEMEKVLEDLDPESPNAMVLQRNINAAKKLRASLNAALDQNKKFQERLDNLDKFKEGLTTEKTEAVKTEKIKQVSALYESEIASLCDASKKEGFRFVDEGEKQDFDRAVRDAVTLKASAIKSDDEFVKVVNEQAKAVYAKMTARREAYVTDYLRKKNGTPQGKKKEEPKQDNRSLSEKLNSIDFADDMSGEKT